MRLVAVMFVAAACAEERPRPDAAPPGGVHASGILDETSDNFHGAELRRRNWDLALCATCHGNDFSGGTSGVSCNGCHTEGPTACSTCHGDGPASGNHVTHAATACSECHTVPTRWDDLGHLGGVEVTFGALASKTPASFDGERCGVYCHGDARPAWNAAPVKACDRCHGNPPATHAQNECATCHPASAPHVDGLVQTKTGCDGCHGGAGDPAPPRDLAGNTFTTALGVGAHQAHLRAASGISAPIACNACHAVPATTSAPGHIDSALPAEVAPAHGWDRTTRTCATAWCHGPARPAWTQAGGAACGSCHGVPPSTSPHEPSMNLSSCASCHPAGFAKHVDGVLDVL